MKQLLILLFFILSPVSLSAESFSYIRNDTVAFSTTPFIGYKVDEFSPTKKPSKKVKVKKEEKNEEYTDLEIFGVSLFYTLFFYIIGIVMIAFGIALFGFGTIVVTALIHNYLK